MKKKHQKLYNAIKDSIENIEKVNVYNEFMYERLLENYTEVPKIEGEKDHRGRVIRPEFIMNVYFPKYVGFTDRSPLDDKVLSKSIYISKQDRKSVTDKKK